MSIKNAIEKYKEAIWKKKVLKPKDETSKTEETKE